MLTLFIRYCSYDGNFLLETIHKEENNFHASTEESIQPYH